MSEQGGDYLLLTGADMDPTLVRRDHPGGRFVARAFLEAKAGEVSPAFAPFVARPGVGDVWGILVRVPDPVGGDPKRRPVTTDDGRSFTAAIAGDRMLNGEPAATLAAARYWELPPGYVGRLAMAVPAPGGADGEQNAGG